MVNCVRCMEEVTDGASCSSCNGQLHYQCSGVTEAGYRKLGDRKLSWRCPACKQPTGKQAPPPDAAPVTASGSTTQTILDEVRALSLKLSNLDKLVVDVKALKDDFQLMKGEVRDTNKSVKEFARRLNTIEDRLDQVEKAKDTVTELQLKLEKIETDLNIKDQWSRMNNVEIKGVAMVKNENLMDIVGTIGAQIQHPVDKSHINYVARIPSRDPERLKSIVVCFNNRYVKENFVAAARAAAVDGPLNAGRLGLPGQHRVYVNDHLTSLNKVLLSKTKALAKDRDFQFVWVKHCKIMARKNTTSPIINVKSEKDLSKII
ncbi:unnamed protein product [Plutella xylostella]|nr:unnamed protein product [Plutella xylostella]